MLVFEIRLPPGAPSTIADDYRIQLQTSENRMPATLDRVQEIGGRAVIAGNVKMYFRARQRLLVLTMPDKTDVLFDLKLGLSPSHTKTYTDWKRATYVAGPEKNEARRIGDTDHFDIRYRVNWIGDE